MWSGASPGRCWSAQVGRATRERKGEENMLRKLFGGAAAIAATMWAGTAAAGAGGGGVLLVPESTNDQVMAFDPFDGSLISMNYIDGSGILGTRINAIQVGNEFWVSDQ